MSAKSNIRCVAVFGGSGFLGREIVKNLLAEKIAVRIAVRSPNAINIPEGSKTKGKSKAIYADVRDETSVALAMEGCNAVINTVGLYVERGTETFEEVHELGALNVAHQCTIKNIDRLLHISGIGADLNSESSYVRARAKGELLAKDVFPHTTILRPSVMFAPNDKFLNTLAKIIRVSPVLPLFGEGRTKLQAVYVGDVAQAAQKALQDPDTKGKTFELGGPKSYTYKDLMKLLLGLMKKKRLMMPMPFILWEALADLVSMLPVPPLTRDQVWLMKHDNVVAKKALTIQDLGVKATPLERILPKYLF